ncbi:MAG: hypothetical protein R2697_15780 [Ilumatobacteraceae bacterium]
MYATDRVDTDHLRWIGAELEMAPVKYAVIGGGEIRRVHPFGGGCRHVAIDDIIRPSRRHVRRPGLVVDDPDGRPAVAA